jgi:hypothetical protein
MKRLFSAFILAATCISLQGKDVIWTTDFESYTGGQNITIDSSGSNDTFSFIQHTQNPTTFTAVSPGTYTGFNTGNAGLVRLASATDGSQYIGFKTDHFAPTLSLGGVWVVSFDAALYNGQLNYVFNDISTDTGSLSLPTQPSANGSSPTIRRITMVINRTGQKITLPFNFGPDSAPYDVDHPDAVNRNSVYVYQRDTNGNYSYAVALGNDIAITGGSSSLVDGFGLLIRSASAGADVQLVLDNFIVLSDPSYHTASGVNILEAMPGMQPSEFIPEPATAALFGLGALFLLRRRFR